MEPSIETYSTALAKAGIKDPASVSAPMLKSKEDFALPVAAVKVIATDTLLTRPTFTPSQILSQFTETDGEAFDLKLALIHDNQPTDYITIHFKDYTELESLANNLLSQAKELPACHKSTKITP